ncbi:Protein-lysine methyltransferase METTL21E [Rhynchospora pubera]|uniref:Protein-lysine methyltransferase METTL21E n=1 Tax=Rhynchospora pubera TaxID=906938 RepID=A0AAV8ELF2_9POAL|nr:Protein-lysine methyltransferase METTL21E [Rhynchospora pubera]
MASSDSDENPDFLLSTLHSDSEEEQQEQKQNPNSALKELDHTHLLHSINATITIREVRSRGLSFQLWPAASSLVSLLDLNPSLLLSPSLQSKQTPLRILELGSGTGLVGIAAAALLGARVTLTDLPNVVPNLQFNAELNSLVVSLRGGFVSVQQLRWGDEQDAADVTSTEKFDLVVGSDVVYYEELIEPLLKTVEVFAKGETAFVMAHLRRWKKRDATFFRKARKNFIVEVLHKDPPLPEWRSGVAVYRLTAKK